MSTSVTEARTTDRGESALQEREHVGRQLDDFTTYSWYETVDPSDTQSRQGFMDLSEVPLPDDLHVFTCGPLPFMRHIRSTLLKRGVPASRIRYEVFGLDLWSAQTPAETDEV